MNNTDYLHLLKWRWKARTDLVWLCQKVINFPDIDIDPHWAFLRHLQRFPNPDRTQFIENDRFIKGNLWRYRPLVPMYTLEGNRRVIIIDPRSGLKTTGTIAHIVQWILNYPDVAIAILQATHEKAEEILGGVKACFQFKPMLRELFPDYCPQKKIGDWGTKSEFTIPNRSPLCPHIVPTCSSYAISAAMAGKHFDVMKFSDIVDWSNLNYQDEIFNQFSFAQALLVKPDSWVDVEGTRYSHSDVYGRIIDSELDKPKEKRRWVIHVRGCWLKEMGDKKPQHTPEELKLPDKIGEDGREISWWPKDRNGGTRFPYEVLDGLRTDAVEGVNFPTQRLNDPSRTQEGQRTFPVIEGKCPSWITREHLQQNVRVAYKDLAVDTAETVNARSNWSVITAGVWDAGGRLYITDIMRGKWLPDELIERVIFMFRKHRPETVKIEEVPFTRGLMTGFRRRMELGDKISNWQPFYIPFQMLKRDTHERKTDRIRDTLQTPYRTSDLRFASDLLPEVKKALLEELERFPAYDINDILDTISDLYQNKPAFGRLQPRPNFVQAQGDAMNQWLGIESIDDLIDSPEELRTNPFYHLTGGF